MVRRKHYHVYVVELSNDVLLNARFMRSNPNYQSGKQKWLGLLEQLFPKDKWSHSWVDVLGKALQS